MKKLLLVIAIFILAGTANATLYSFDLSAQGFTDGQNLEGMIAGPSAITSEQSDLRYYTGYGGGIGTDFDLGSVGDIYFDFSEAVSDLSFRGGDGLGDDDAFAVTLYEFGTNNLLGTWSTPIFGGANEPEWYTLVIGIGNVGRAVLDPGNSGALPGNLNDAGGLIVTNYGFTTGAAAIPEPATMLLVGLGMAGMGLIRRKRS